MCTQCGCGGAHDQEDDTCSKPCPQQKLVGKYFDKCVKAWCNTCNLFRCSMDCLMITHEETNGCVYKSWHISICFSLVCIQAGREWWCSGSKLHISWGRKAWGAAYLMGKKNTFSMEVSRWGTWLLNQKNVVLDRHAKLKRGDRRCKHQLVDVNSLPWNSHYCSWRVEQKENVELRCWTGVV